MSAAPNKCKKLKNVLPTIKKGTIIKIGSKVSFIYAYYYNDRTIERLQKESDKIFQKLNRWLLKATTMLEDNEERIKKKATKIRKLKALIKNYKPLLERRVIEMYESDPTYEPNTIIIILNGSEAGGYWNIDEYAKKNKLYIAQKDRHYPNSYFLEDNSDEED